MAYVGMNTQLAHELGRVLHETATRADPLRRDVETMLGLADLSSGVSGWLAVVEESLRGVGGRVLDSVGLAERFVADPQMTSAELAVPVDALMAQLSGQLGLAGPIRIADRTQRPALLGGDMPPRPADPLRVAPPPDLQLPSPYADLLERSILSEPWFASVLKEVERSERLSLPSGQHPPTLMRDDPFDVAQAGGNSTSDSGGLTLATPDSNIQLSPFYLGWPFSAGGNEFNIAGIGNSFLAGEGTRNYILPGALPSIHQSPDAGLVQAVEQLQEQYPTATVRITYSADPGTTRVVPPRVGVGDGSVINLSFVAESGATSASMLGLARTDRTDSPLTPQYLAAAGAHFLVVEAGGNDAGAVDMLRPALTGNGVAHIDASTAAIPEATRHFPLLLERLSEISGGAPGVVVGYPNIFTPVNGGVATGPLNPGANDWTDNLDAAELGAIARWGFTVNNTLAGHVDDAASSGRPFTFLNRWGTWGADDTVGAPNALVNDLTFQPSSWWNPGTWYQPEQESYHPNLGGNKDTANALYPHLRAAAEPHLGLPLDVRHQLSYVSPEDPILQSIPEGVSLWQPSAPPGQPLPPAEQALLFADPPAVDPWQPDAGAFTDSYPFSLPMDLGGTNPDTYWDDTDFNDLNLDFSTDYLSPTDYLQ